MSAKITSLLLKDVRCFAGEHRVELARVTILVGENSTGKSTFLGCLNGLAILASLAELSDRTNYFDETPFYMGSYENLVRSGCPSFGVGIGLEDDRIRRLEIEFATGNDGAPRESALELELSNIPPHPGGRLRITRETSGNKAERWRFDGPGFEFELDQSEVSYSQFTTWLSQAVRRNELPFGGDVTQFRKRMGSSTGQELATFGKFINFFRHQFRASKTPLKVNSIDPNSFRRKRSYRYDPLRVSGGSKHLELINDVGRKLGLFNRIDVRECGPNHYEVLADISGVMRNLVDVGYGVTSVLPFIQVLGGSSHSHAFPTSATRSPYPPIRPGTARPHDGREQACICRRNPQRSRI